MKSDGLFYWKRHVVLLKTTRCFIENDTLFCWKRYVVLLKTTRRFFSTHVFFLDNERKMKKRKEKRKIKCEKSHNQVLSRVRVRTRCQEFLSFCCHKCHSTLRKSLFLNLLRYIFRFVFTKTKDEIQGCAPNSDGKTAKKQTFCPFIVQYFPLFWLDFPSNAWHLWQQKINIAVGRRAYARTREKSNAIILQSRSIKFYVSAK